MGDAWKSLELREKLEVRPVETERRESTEPDRRAVDETVDDDTQDGANDRGSETSTPSAWASL